MLRKLNKLKSCVYLASISNITVRRTIKWNEKVNAHASLNFKYIKDKYWQKKIQAILKLKISILEPIDKGTRGILKRKKIK